MAMTKVEFRLFRVAIAAELLALGGFGYAGWRADDAMDKSGLGNYGQFLWWTKWANVAFWAAVVIWVLGMLIAWRLDRSGARSPLGNSSFVLFCVGAPVTLVLAYVAMIAWH